MAGREKATILLSLLGDQASDILKLMNPDQARILAAQVQNAPKRSASEVGGILADVVARIRQYGAHEREITAEEDVASEAGASGLGQEAEPRVFRAASRLAQQKPQIVAFVLSRLSDEERQAITSHLPENLRQVLQHTKVETIPLSEQVYQSIYQRLFNES